MDKKTLKIITRRVLEYSKAVDEEGKDKEGLEAHIDALAEVFAVDKEEVAEIAQQVIDSEKNTKTFKEYFVQHYWKFILAFLLIISILSMGLLITKLHSSEEKSAVSYQNQMGMNSGLSSLSSSTPIDPNGSFYLHKAIFSQILGSVMSIRMSVIEYMMMEGDYPKQLEDMGLKRATMKSVKYIEDLKLGSNGQIIIYATEKLGQGIYITVTPKKVMGGLNIEWECHTNYSKSKLYVCEQLDSKKLVAEDMSQSSTEFKYCKFSSCRLGELYV